MVPFKLFGEEVGKWNERSLGRPGVGPARCQVQRSTCQPPLGLRVDQVNQVNQVIPAIEHLAVHHQQLEQTDFRGKVSWDWSVGTGQLGLMCGNKIDAREVAVSTIGIDGSKLAFAWLAVTGRFMYWTLYVLDA